MEEELELRARMVERSDPKVFVEGELHAADKVTATVWGVFVAVKEGHPAYHRWSPMPCDPDPRELCCLSARLVSSG